jgi:hypothetical protein
MTARPEAPVVSELAPLIKALAAIAVRDYLQAKPVPTPTESVSQRTERVRLRGRRRVA